MVYINQKVHVQQKNVSMGSYLLLPCGNYSEIVINSGSSWVVIKKAKFSDYKGI